MNKKYLEVLLSDKQADCVYKCPSCGCLGFSYEAYNSKCRLSFEACGYCGLNRMLYTNDDDLKMWNQAWVECGSKKISDLNTSERYSYYSEIELCYYNLKYKIDDDNIFKKRGLDYVKKNGKILRVENEIGQIWEFSYETNINFMLGDESNCLMIIEEFGFPRLLVSERLARRCSDRLSYPGLVPQIYKAAYAFTDSTVCFESMDGIPYTASIVFSNQLDICTRNRFGSFDFERKSLAMTMYVNPLNMIIKVQERGLSGVKLIIGDKCLGMLETIPETFPDTPWY